MRKSAAILALFAGCLSAQDVTLGRVSFEVAAIKPTAVGGNMRPMRFAVSPSGSLTVANMPVQWLIANAWGLPEQSVRIVGAPAWVKSDPYDIQAVAPGMFAPGISARERETRTRVLLRALLSQRFGLVIREESREMTAYALVPAKRGHKLRRAAVEEKDCPVTPSDDGIYCHHLHGGTGGLHGPAVDMADLALYLENWVERPVVDETGIAGLYRIETEGWEGDQPSIFRILEDTLGLKLEAKKAKVTSYVIERIERPTAN